MIRSFSPGSCDSATDLRQSPLPGDRRPAVVRLTWGQTARLSRGFPMWRVFARFALTACLQFFPSMGAISWASEEPAVLERLIADLASANPDTATAAARRLAELPDQARPASRALCQAVCNPEPKVWQA